MVDIDGVISLFGVPGAAPNTPATRSDGGNDEAGETGPDQAVGAAGAVSDDRGELSGSLHSIDGILHFLSSTAAAHLHTLAGFFELVWASGWEEKADEHLPRLLGLPPSLPFLRFSRTGGQTGTSTQAHWKLEAIETYAAGRPLAWIDDAFNPACHEWAAARAAPTLLVTTAPQRGLTSTETRQLVQWAGRLEEALRRVG